MQARRVGGKGGAPGARVMSARCMYAARTPGGGAAHRNQGVARVHNDAPGEHKRGGGVGAPGGRQTRVLPVPGAHVKT